MKKRIIITLFLFICLSIFSCAFNNSSQRKQSAALKELGVAYMIEGNYAIALEKLLEAQKLDKTDPFIYNYLGLVFMAQHNYTEAVEHFTKAIKITPEYSTIKNNLGVAYANMKNWDKAIEIFKEITNDAAYSSPQYPLANIGWAYFNKKEYSIAENYYIKALKLSPNFLIALHGLGRVYVATKEYQKATFFLKKVIELSPNSTIAKEAEKELSLI